MNWTAGLSQRSSARQAHADETLTIDERGNVQSRSVDGRISNYRYDPLDRLKSESGKATQSFGLDPNGNRSSDGVATYSVQANGNRLVSRNGVALTYDAAGNLLSDQSRLNGATVSRSFTYSPAGMLRTASINGVLVATYSYDHLGLRSKKVLASPPANTPATTLYRYDPNGHLVEEIAGSGPSSGQTLLTYLWKDDIPSAIIYAPGTPSNPGAQERIVYLHADHLNTPRKASDAQGRIVWSWESDAFGSSAPNEDPGSTGLKTTINLRFPGQYYDAETGLSNNWHRYYDAQSGRYAQSDPIGLEGGISTYGYVNGSPVIYVDPWGLAKDSITASVEAAIGRGDLKYLQTLAESGGLNPAQSQLGTAGIQRLESTASELIAKELQGSVNRVFPGQLRNKTLAEILQGAREGDKACQTARKLLTDSRFAK